MAPAILTSMVDGSAQNTFDGKQVDPFYSATNQAHLIRAIHELNEGKGTIHELIKDDE
ncbi:MAG: hypothetical protein IJ088_04025 [Clostridia bacterium]|nr:hypothetical protein [Clostridia bacterium]